MKLHLLQYFVYIQVFFDVPRFNRTIFRLVNIH